MNIQEDYPRSSVEKPGWKLTFCDDFDSPLLDDMYWFPAYRSGRKEYFKRIGVPSRWQNHNAYYEINNSILKLKITPDLPPPNTALPTVVPETVTFVPELTSVFAPLPPP